MVMICYTIHRAILPFPMLNNPLILSIWIDSINNESPIRDLYWDNGKWYKGQVLDIKNKVKNEENGFYTSRLHGKTTRHSNI